LQSKLFGKMRGILNFSDRQALQPIIGHTGILYPIGIVIVMFFLGLPVLAQSLLTENPTGMTGSIRGLDVVSNQVVWISGTKGEFTVTRNSGETWYQGTVTGAEEMDFRDVHGFSADVALLMAAGPGKASAIYRTDNGGKSWTIVYQNADEKAFFDGMDFFDDKHGLLIGDPTGPKPYLMVTMDGGLSWARLNPERIPDLIPGEYAFAASGTSLDTGPGGDCCFVTGGSAARYFFSADRGRHWEVLPLPMLQGDPAAGAFSVSRGPGPLVAVAGGNYQKMTLTGSNIAISNDKGLTWTGPAGAAQVPFMECVRWIDAGKVVACGPPGVWISSDAGVNWHQISTEGFHAMDVTDGTGIIWLAGAKGKIVSIKL
jgi:photosystem II stability/assembly factor-like uncharacterized protein